MISKKLKIILMSISGGLVVAGTGLGLASCGEPKPDPEPFIEPDNDPCPEGECVDENQDGFCDLCGYPVEMKHGVSISGDPSAPFYLKVGQEKTVKATLSPSPERAEEKTFTWKKSNNNALITVDKSNSAKAIVQGIQEGRVVLTATNDYNPALARNFTANVINYDDDNMYLWEYQSSDRAKFGYVNEAGKKQGDTEGIATLGTIDWAFERSSAISLQSNKGGLGFGKGSKPETLVTLTSHNDRQIKKVVIETASSKALANITVKVGDNEIINRKTPNYSDDAIGSVLYEDDEMNPKKYTGDIKIQFDTPEYDSTRAEDPTYQAPGAVYLKSIWIEYYEIELDWKTNVSYDFEAKFLEKAAPFDALAASAKPINFVDEENGIQIKFSAVVNPDKDTSKGIQGYALTNGDIEVISTKPDEVIKKVTFIYQNGSTVPTYDEYSSVFGGEPYTDLLDTQKGDKNTTTKVGKFIKADNVNAVKFINSQGKTTHYKVGIKSIEVKTIAGSQLKVKKLELGPSAQLNKTSYKVGETFNPAGLQNINVSFTDETAPIIPIPSSVLTYYDATTYDTKGVLDTFLQEGTTEVVALLCGVEFRVDGIEVVLVKMNFEKVTSLEQINTTSRYLVTSPENASFALGSSGSDLNNAKGALIDPSIDFGDTTYIPDCYEGDLFTFEINNVTGTYKFVNSDKKHTWGLTTKKASSASIDTEYTQWKLEFLDEVGEPGVLKISMEIDDETYSLYNNGSKFDSKKIEPESVSNIVLYKLTSIVDPRVA